MPRKTKYNNITSPALLEQVNPENKRLKNDFLTYLKSVQRSNGTIDGYSHDLDIFFVWNLQNNNNKFFVDLSKRDLISYQNWLIYENENSPARVRRLKAALSSLSNYVENILDDEYEGYRPIVRKIESPINQPVREKTVFSDEQLQSLLDILVKEERFTQACALSLAMCSGRRKSELLRLKVDWFTNDNIIYGSLYKTPEKVKTKGAGNGKYLYCYTLSKEFDPYLDLYMNWRKENNVESEWLFYDKADPTKQMNISTLNSWAVRFSKILGVPFYWHGLRHFFTTKLARLGLPDSVVQTVIGWSSADMVRLYDDTPDDEQLEKYFGEDGIKTDVKATGLADL